MGKAVSLEEHSTGIQDSLNEMLTRGKSVESFLNRVTFGQFKEAQIARFQSNNETEGTPWDVLTTKYQTWKEKQAAGGVMQSRMSRNAKKVISMAREVKGGGKIIMVLTGTLAAAATGESGALLKLATENSLKVYIDETLIPYAAYPGLKRPYMSFSESTEERFMSSITAWLMTGDETGGI